MSSLKDHMMDNEALAEKMEQAHDAAAPTLGEAGGLELVSIAKSYDNGLFSPTFR